MTKINDTKITLREAVKQGLTVDREYQKYNCKTGCRIKKYYYMIQNVLVTKTVLKNK